MNRKYSILHTWSQTTMERRLLGVYLRDRLQNTEIRCKIGVKNIGREIWSQKLRWASHIARTTQEVDKGMAFPLMGSEARDAVQPGGLTRPETGCWTDLDENCTGQSSLEEIGGRNLPQKVTEQICNIAYYRPIQEVKQRSRASKRLLRYVWIIAT